MKVGIILIFSILFISCGAKNEVYFESYYTSDPYALDGTLNNLSLGVRTPVGLGTLIKKSNITKKKFSIGLCTWFLIDKDHAMTNSHCIPKEVKKNQKLNKCAHFIKGIFRTEEGDIKRSCEKVLYFSKTKGNGGVFSLNDYAILKINESVELSDYFKISRDGVKEDELISIETMNHTSWEGGTFSKYIKHRCIVKSSNFFKVLRSKGTSPVTVFKKEGSDDYCKTIGGNSGSPVISSDRKVIGILHGGLSEETEDDFSRKEVTKEVSVDVGIITNFRCMKISKNFVSDKIPSRCNYKSKDESRETMVIKNELIDSKIVGKFEEVKARQPVFFKYSSESIRVGNDFEIVQTPKCVIKNKEWEDSNLDIKGMIEVPKFSLKLVRNYYGNRVLTLKQVRTQFNKFELIIPKDFKGSEKVVFKTDFLNEKLDLCDEEKDSF